MPSPAHSTGNGDVVALKVPDLEMTKGSIEYACAASGQWHLLRGQRASEGRCSGSGWDWKGSLCTCQVTTCRAALWAEHSKHGQSNPAGVYDYLTLSCMFWTIHLLLISADQQESEMLTNYNSRSVSVTPTPPKQSMPQPKCTQPQARKMSSAADSPNMLSLKEASALQLLSESNCMAESIS